MAVNTCYQQRTKFSEFSNFVLFVYIHIWSVVLENTGIVREEAKVKDELWQQNWKLKWIYLYLLGRKEIRWHVLSQIVFTHVLHLTNRILLFIKSSSPRNVFSIGITYTAWIPFLDHFKGYREITEGNCHDNGLRKFLDNYQSLIQNYPYEIRTRYSSVYSVKRVCNWETQLLSVM